MDEKLKDAIFRAAANYAIDPAIVYGVCRAESNLDQYAIRYEPHYKWLYRPEEVKPHNCSSATERCSQQFSWGLMQVMGAVYRELGYRGWLSAVVNDIDVQLEYGCRHLGKKIHAMGLRDGISAYNAGSPTPINKSYVDKVLSYAEEWDDR